MSADNPKILPSANTADKGTAAASRGGVRNLKGEPSSNLGTFGVKSGLAQMLKGGVIMDVVSPEQARIAEEAGACAVMALERVPADIRVQGGVARMSDPAMIQEIIDSVTIPVMAKCRIGHFVEAQILQACNVDYSTRVKCLLPRTTRTTSTSTTSRCHSSVAAATWVRRCAASVRVLL